MDMSKYIIIQIVGSIVHAIFISRTLLAIILDPYAIWLNLRGYHVYTCIKKSSIVYGWQRDSDTNELWTAIAHYISNTSIRGSAYLKENESITVLPRGYVWYDNIAIRSRVLLISESDKSTITQHVLKVYAKSNTQLDEFIAMVRKQYKDYRNSIAQKQHYYMPTTAEYIAQHIPPLTPFSRVHFPGKDELLCQVDRIEANPHLRFNLLLSGTPGCGKTTIISAIAERTGRSVVEINFAVIKTPQQLFTLFFTDIIEARVNGVLRTLTLPNTKRLYVIEELDTLGKLIAKRIAGDKVAVKTKNNENIDIAAIKAKAKSAANKGHGNELTLGHLLTVLDGFRQTTGAIIVMTTNHVEMLDPALIRDGRVHMHIVMQPCLVADAVAIIRRDFPDYPADSYPLKDGEITPARLETCMARATYATLNEIIKAARV